MIAALDQTLAPRRRYRISPFPPNRGRLHAKAPAILPQDLGQLSLCSGGSCLEIRIWCDICGLFHLGLRNYGCAKHFFPFRIPHARDCSFLKDRILLFQSLLLGRSPGPRSPAVTSQVSGGNRRTRMSFFSPGECEKISFLWGMLIMLVLLFIASIFRSDFIGLPNWTWTFFLL